MMKHIVKFAGFIALINCLCAPVAFSHCATGVDVGGGQCIPPDAPGMPGYSQQSAQPKAVWADRWGAIVVDRGNGQTGVAVEQRGESEAIAIAMRACSNNGGTHCELILPYRNQCAAVAFGGGKMGSSGSPTKEQAERLAIDTCARGNCKVVYSACSLPQRIR